MVDNKYKMKFGLVILLDALGISNLSIAESAIFINSRNIIMDDLNSHMLEVTKDLPIRPIKPTTYTFGDSILLTFELAEFTDLGLYITLSGLLMSRLIVKSISGTQSPILYRGAVSYGEFLEDKDTNTVIGPAIADAASWYEEADWSGIIATPRFSLLVNQSMEELSNSSEYLRNFLSASYVFYDVPTKSKLEKKLAVVAWPAFFFPNISVPYYPGVKLKKNETPYGIISGHLARFQIKKGTENKYFNTLKFFKWYSENFVIRPVKQVGGLCETPPKGPVESMPT